MRAELVEDGGELARSADFFRSAEFQRVEEVTHSLVVGDRFAAGLVVRDIADAGGLRDATSAYGYPGAIAPAAPEPLDPAEVDWSGTGLVSVFLRDAIGGEPCLEGGTLRSEVQLVDPRSELQVRSTHARHIRRNERLGYVTEESGEIEAFGALYRQTMARTGAAERYFFDDAYLGGALASPKARLLITRAPDGRSAAGALLVESDGMLHYFLGGTADGLLEHSPFKNTMAAMIDVARESDMPLNLGGGLSPGDALEHFKRGFANSSAPFHTHELVCDRAAYERLSAPRPRSSGFFPLYRAPG
ncbi:MAG TPA: GNAT family N-acetyltransferase [Thermoleophilaceae bacterium]|nr:GNAT family N-acetyltransferase [Thermoleophilaceae bacterium]